MVSNFLGICILYLPGIMVCLVISLAATFISEHYSGPQLLYALFIGLSFHFLMSHGQIKKGVDFCARTLLRCGVALLGARITFVQVSDLGWSTAIVVVVAMGLTIAIGLFLARFYGKSSSEGLISGGSVAICGASAAMAIASVLPQTKENERFTLLVVVGVTVLSTIAMVIYPFALDLMKLNAQVSGIFIGATIHDVAQVVAAGMLLGPEAGDTATIVKLFRVILLMPIVVLIVIVSRNQKNTNLPEKQQPLVPTFLVFFVVFVLLSSMGIIPTYASNFATETSRSLLVIAIVAAGIKTSFEDLLKLGWQPVVMLVTETLFIACFMYIFIAFNLL